MLNAERLVRLAGQVRARARPVNTIDRSLYYLQGWQCAAERLEFELADLGDGYLRAGSRGVLFHEASVGVDSVATFELAGNKAVGQRLLTNAGVRVPESTLYSSGSRSLRSELWGSSSRRVLKPAQDTGGGRGVTVAPPNRWLAMRAIGESAALCPELICETYHPGQAIRVLVLDGEVLDAVERSPACVTGDGESTVRELILAENARRRCLGSRTTGFIELGSDCASAISRQSARFSDVLPSGQEMLVAGRSNTGSELESRRVTLSSESANAALLAAKALAVRLAGVDLIVNDGRLEVVLEVNTTPGLHWHSLVAEEPFDVFHEVMRRVVGQ